MNFYQLPELLNIKRKNIPFRTQIKKFHSSIKNKTNFNFYLDIFGTRMKLLKGAYTKTSSISEILNRKIELVKNDDPNISYVFISISKPDEKIIDIKYILLGWEKEVWNNDVKYLKIINNYSITKIMSPIFLEILIELIVRYKYVSFLRYNGNMRKQLYFYILFTYINENKFQISSHLNFGYYYFKIYKFFFGIFYWIEFKIFNINIPYIIKVLFINFIHILLFNIMIIFKHDAGSKIFFNFQKKYNIDFEKYYNQLKIYNNLTFSPNLNEIRNNYFKKTKEILLKQKEKNIKNQERNLSLLAIFIAFISIIITIIINN